MYVWLPQFPKSIDIQWRSFYPPRHCDLNRAKPRRQSARGVLCRGWSPDVSDHQCPECPGSGARRNDMRDMASCKKGRKITGRRAMGLPHFLACCKTWQVVPQKPGIHMINDIIDIPGGFPKQKTTWNLNQNLPPQKKQMNISTCTSSI